jgi:hypothetical protein
MDGSAGGGHAIDYHVFNQSINQSIMALLKCFFTGVVWYWFQRSYRVFGGAADSWLLL